MELRDGYQGIKNAGATELIAITGDSITLVSNTQLERNISFPMLSDDNLVAIKAYNVLNPNDTRFAHPTAFIIDEEGKVAWKDTGRRFGHRTDSQQIIAALQGL